MNQLPPLITIIGRSNSGKTTLIEKLIAHYAANGLRIATIKHMKHDFDIDHEGKDTHRFRSAGAFISSITNDRQLAIVADAIHGATPMTAAEPIFSKADLIIVEGNKESRGPKVEVIGDSTEPPLFASGVSDVAAIVTDRDISAPFPRFRRDEIAAVAQFIDRLVRGREPDRR